MKSVLSLNESQTLLFRLRGVVLLVQLAFVVLAFSLDMTSKIQFFASFGVIAVLFFTNLILISAQKVNLNESLQVSFDFILCSYLLFINGGFQNPLAMVLIIHVFMAPLFLEKKELIYFIICIFLSLMALHYTPFSLDYKSLSFILSFELSLVFILFLLFFISCWFFFLVKKMANENKKLQNFTLKMDRYRSLGLLAAGVCHELGTPLNTIQLSLDRLRRSDLEDKEELDVIERNLSKSTDSLRKLNSHVHDQSYSFFKESYALSELLNSFKRLVEQDEKITFIDEVNFFRDEKIAIPKTLFLRSLWDLYENSFEAKASFFRITTLEAENKNFFILKIEDDGQGFHNEILGQLGEPFVSSKPMGSGLGLYHLFNIMHLAGGEVELKNEAAAVVELYFPRNL